MLSLAVALISSSFAHENPTPEDVSSWMDSVVLLVNNGAWCSGALIEESGVVVTAYHCVASGRDTVVEFRTGDQYNAKTIAVDPSHDLALLQLQEWSAKGPTLTVRSTSVEQGEVVYAMGHPYAPYAEKPILRGTLKWAVSSGIVSAIGERLIQVDAPLNPGNSGGPVVDSNGEIIGIASRKLRGDNLSFLGPAKKISLMQKEMEAQAWWGGQLSFGLGLQVPLDGFGQNLLTGQIELLARDRWIFGLQTMLQDTPDELSKDQWVPANALRFSRRHRIGVGELTAAIDWGVGVTHQWYPVDPKNNLLPTTHIRGSTGNISVRGEMLWLDQPQWLLSVELHVPGIVQVF